MPNDKDGFLYMKVYNDLRERIENDEIRSGERLPAELALKKVYGVSRDTMRKALAKLENDGYITRTAATGTFVRISKSDYSLFSHESFSEQMLKIGKRPSSEILSIELTDNPPADIVQKLALRPGERIYKICRIRKADGEPMAYEIVFVPTKLCPNLHTHIYEDTSLYEVYENVYNLRMDTIRFRIEAELADGNLQKLLGLKANSAVLKYNATMDLEGGQPFYHVISYHIGSKYVFTTMLPRKKNGNQKKTK